MKLSILLPTHDRADVLPFAIESVLVQDFTDFELLVCGDGCTDATAKVVQHYAAEDARVRWFDFPKAPGFGYANRNRALKEARGELIGFMAHDDLITADHFALLVQAMEDPAAQLAYTEAVWAGRDGAMVPAVFHLEDQAMRDAFLAKQWNRIPATCFMHRREAFDKVGWWSEELPRGADLDLWGRIINAYGESSIKAVSAMSCFHFRAHWRLEDIAPDTEPVWLQLHRAPGRLPEAMHWEVPAGMSEQQAFWERLKGQPEFITSLRTACHHAVMSYAWHLEQQLSAQQGLAPVVELDRKIQALREQKAALQVKLTERDARLLGLKEEMEILRRETKVPKWLRWLRGN